jgi:very-short-patch-repair endonuclease
MLDRVEHSELFEIAASQLGLFTRQQARQVGYSPKQISTRVGDGRWRRVIGSTLTAGAPVHMPRTLDLAAYLAAGEPAVLSGPSAARVYDMPVPDSPPCLTVPRWRHLSRLGIVQLRGRIDDGEAVMIDGVLVTAKARTAIDCLRLLQPEDALVFLDRALQQRWVSAETLVRRVADGDQLRGIEQLRMLAEQASIGAHSEAERLAATIFEDGQLGGWVANLPVRLRDGSTAVVDFAFPRVKLAVEIDGRAWHVDRTAFQQDRTRQNALVAAGWTVLRFTWDDLTARPDRVLAEVHAAISRLAA